ncbi:hypothetical protein C8P68_102355 [Mucilaginibacter yixingensis]|uniref:Uncharacterized protein n=1 Tax=Mucilaginibacter yixingensis TaxID=1295612 RepID=A0A2T5JCP1_9SPHI|nr:hypothetical protein [Mucilaginibacter yixingensis]PTQ99531.1 hypothetical protein C8P68_102355 [Mucilaginibacter yixingensis]
MNKTILSTQIKLEILTICSGPISRPDNLINQVQLFMLGYDDFEDWCRQLEKRLQLLAVEYQTGKEIAEGHINGQTTVDQCIQMVV